MILLWAVGCCLHHAGIVPWTHPGCWSPSALSFWQCCQPQQVKDLQERAELALCRESEQKEPSSPSKCCLSRLHEHYRLHTRQKAKAPFLGVAVATALQRFLCSPCRAGWRVQALEGHLVAAGKISVTAAESQQVSWPLREQGKLQLLK